MDNFYNHLRKELDSFYHSLSNFYFPESSKLSYRTDAEALKEDWKKVGGDLWTAIEKFEKEHPDLLEKLNNK